LQGWNKAGDGREKAPVKKGRENSRRSGGGGVVKAKPDAGGREGGWGPMDRALSVDLVLARFVHVAW